jgi:RimJ/RimL family protein N-acetyltransferase
MAGTDSDTSRLWLRTWTHDAHSDSFAAILADPVAMRFISGGEPLPRQVADEISLHSERLWNEGFGPWAAFLKDNDSFVGRVGLNRLDDWPGEEKIEVGFGKRLAIGTGGSPRRAPKRLFGSDSKRLG